MNKNLFTAHLCCLLFSVSEAQYLNNSPVDTITSGQFNDTHPALCTSMFLWTKSPQWLLFERHTNDSSFIMGKRFDPLKARWDIDDTVIASSPAESPLLNPGIAAITVSSGITFCAVWQKNVNNRGSINYSFYNDSIGRWSVPVQLAGDSLSHEDPAVRAIRTVTIKKEFSVIWSRKNVLLHAAIAPGIAPVIDTIATTDTDHPKFDFCDYSSNTVGVVFAVHGVPLRTRLCNTVFTYKPFQILSSDTLPVSIEELAHPRFVQSYSSPVLLWEENNINVPRIMVTSLIGFQPQIIPGTAQGVMYDVKAFTLPIVTQSQIDVPRFFFFNVLSYSCFNGTDTVVMIHGPVLSVVDTIRSKGYNASSSIGSFMCNRSGTNHSLVVWESNRTGRSHIYGKLVYNPLNDVKEEPIIPYEFTLFQNYPNPFNPNTTIAFAMKNTEQVNVTVYNAIGQAVTTLYNGVADAGRVYSLNFNGRNLSSGTYFYALRSASHNEVKKMLLTK